MTDRELAYEQNVSGLEVSWRERIERFAHEAVRDATESSASAFPSGSHDDIEETAREQVEERLLNSEQWQNVKATDISDIAREAVDREIDSNREPADNHHYNR